MTSVKTRLAERLLLDTHGGELLRGHGHVDERSQADGRLTRAAGGHVVGEGLCSVETAVTREHGVGASHKGRRQHEIGGEEAGVEIGAIRGTGERSKRLERAETHGAIAGRTIAGSRLQTGIERVNGDADASKSESDVELKIARNIVAAVRGRTDAPGTVERIEGTLRTQIDAGTRIKDGDGTRAGNDAGCADGDGLGDAVLHEHRDLCERHAPMPYDAVGIADGAGVGDVGVGAASIGGVMVADGQDAVARAAILLETLQADSNESSTWTGIVPEAGEDGTCLWWTNIDIEEGGVTGGVEVGLDETVGGWAYADDAGKVARVHILVANVVAGAKCLRVDDESGCGRVTEEHGGGLDFALGRAEEIADVERGILVDDRVGTVVELEDGQALVAATRVVIAILVGEPEIAAARVELGVELLVGGGDGDGIGELSVGKAST